jgi:hypothetical protein
MTLPIQLISTDFDGTLFAEFENPPGPAGLQALLQTLRDRGARWVINTGRDMSSLMDSLARARLTILPDYLVLVEREIYVRTGTRYCADAAWNRRCTDAHAALFDRIRPDIPELMAWVTTRFQATVYEDPFSPFCLVAGNNDDADAIVTHLDAYCRQVPDLTVVRNDVYARFSHAGFTKGTALGEIARQLGIPRDRVLAAGDHLNDLPMLSRDHAGFLIAPANAIPAVKDAVRRQHGYLSDEPCGYGVLDGLEHFLNRQGDHPAPTPPAQA